MSDVSYQPPNLSEVTQLLDEIRSSPELFDRLMPLVYDDMKRIGRAQRRRLGPSDTLQTTALVHEAFLKLRQNASERIDSNLHLQRLVACVMRQLIFDYARKQLTIKRGGDQVRATWNENEHALPPEDLNRIMAVEKAVDEMAASDPRMAECLTSNLFGGSSVTEIGEMLGVSSRTVVRDLRRARAWLQVELAHLESAD
ncbi:sigma-70 family RNA polymerase sigma factor [Wenzhouxiangella sp. AB-CW3]|uniref:ECF-type sigma factor n=1 Tax=Wenzhouxiangella sp. AB-CW3 TaxID=2771012 RepID=UPI00168AE150|nr:ECF-type sigma factor [Wenzhouxiangella sp. AB-CW3]QOC23914.1 sigma-70 family RNA polymerase sigma factor [Wenzhouxiangella sp. AB-CW3]